MHYIAEWHLFLGFGSSGVQWLAGYAFLFVTFTTLTTFN